MTRNKQHKTKEPEYESDSGTEDEETFESNDVDVGYIDPDLYVESTYDERKMTKTVLKSPFFVSKVGGKPQWLNHHNLPLAVGTVHVTNDNESDLSPIYLQCNNCKSQLKFLLQLYAPISENDKFYNKLESSEDVFHRVLYIFLCVNTECLPVSGRSLKVYRSQLRHKNDFFSQNPPPALDSGDDEKDQKSADDFLLDYYKNLYEKSLLNKCSVCGLVSTKKCAKCQFSHYCCYDHQVFDWTKENHKAVCEGYLHWSNVENDVDELLKLYIEKENAPGALSDLNQGLNNYVFPEYEIIIEPEVIETKPVKKEKKKNDFDVEKLTLDLENNVALDQDLENVKENECDRDFEKFNKRTKDEPTQIIRYDRGGEPFWVTKYEKLKKDSVVPNCQYCNSKRMFEFQVNPQLLNYLGIEEGKQLNSLDWAGLYIYTCSKSCTFANKTYAEEYIYKQEFV